MSDYDERGVVFNSNDNRLVGIAAVPDSHADVGLLILVGGPQYRVGSHRQFTLLARDLAGAGIPSFRFDYSGMGDSEGVKREFYDTEDDVRAAIDIFFDTVEGLSRVVIWGLCDAASMAMMFAHQDPRVAGMVLLNPWVHSGEYSPEVKLSHYYRPSLAGKDSWRRLFTGKINVFSAFREFALDSMRLIKNRLGSSSASSLRNFFVQDMLGGFQRFQHGALFILSEDDLTAREFSGLINRDKNWSKAISKPGTVVHKVPEADHTFSRKIWKDKVSQMTIDWVKQL